MLNNQKLLLVLAFLVPFIYTACNGVKFDEPVCDPHGLAGKRLGVWLDPNNTGVISSENYLGSFVSYTGSDTAATNYGYYSDSAHPIVGPAPGPYNVNVFFYEGNDGLTFNFFFNIDKGGSPDNEVQWDIYTRGNDYKDRVKLSDDPNDTFYLDGIEGENQKYIGRWHYWKNTDGGVIGPFDGEDFFIRVKSVGTGDLTGANFYSADGTSLSLQDGNNTISSFIIGFEAHGSTSACP